VTAPHPLRLALWLGLLTGMAEITLQAIERFVLHRLIFLGDDFGWMIPLADVALFLVAGSILWAGQRFWPTRVTPEVGLGLLATLSGWAVLLMYPPLHRGAALLLAAGVGYQCARLLPLASPGFHRLLRLSTAAMLGVVVLCALVPRLTGSRREHATVAALLPARAGAPNVLLIILDTVRAMSLSLYGYERPTTPQLQRWASQGVVFDMALSPAPWTLPSHASMFTGRWPHELGVDWRVGLAPSFPTLAEQLAAAGYRTAGFVANTTYCSEETGINRGFQHWEDYPVSFQMVVKSASLGRALTGAAWFRDLFHWYQPLARKHAAEISASLLGWLGDGSAEPWFVALNYLDAHAPYLPPAPFRDQFGPTEPRSNPTLQPFHTWLPEEITRQQNAYDASIAALDDELGRLFDSLEARGALRNTLVIVTSDHGEEFYEHQLMDHGNSLYLPSIHVPLLLWLPGTVPAGRRVTVPVTTRDLPATIMALAAPQEQAVLPGRSLVPLWADGGSAKAPDTLLSEVNYASGLPDRYPVSKGPMRSLLLEGLRLIKNGDQTTELYDFSTDQAEQTDLAAADTAAVSRLSRILEQLTTPSAARASPP
jgi:arylsulfatase A-like enzyme